MLILLRYANLILALILLVSLIIGFSWLIKYLFEQRFNARNRKQKAKAGELPSDAGIRDLILQGNIQEAIDLYQQFTGVDRFTAEEAIHDMQREIRLGTMKNEIASVLEDRGKAAAIQAYQDLTGNDFNAGLTYIEQIERSS